MDRKRIVGGTMTVVLLVNLVGCSGSPASTSGPSIPTKHEPQPKPGSPEFKGLMEKAKKSRH